MINKNSVFFIFLFMIFAFSAAASSNILPDGFNLPVQDVGGPFLYSIEVPDDPEIDHYIYEYSSENGQKTMSAIIKRGAPYLGYIYNRLIEENMPPELLFLPAIESGFRAWALSHSGASGFWQFMMNSISPYDITVDEWRDDRRDFYKATEAAVHKLKLNYERTGSWPLAIAAYNCGLGRIERAVADSGSTDYIELYELGYIPEETRNYLPKFFAFAHLAAYAERLEVSASVHYRSTAAKHSDKWTRIELDQAVNLVILASKTGIPVSFLHEANAELRHGITPPASSIYFLKVPEYYSDNVREVLRNTNEPLMRFYIHEIRSGDTFYALSGHFGVPVSMIEMYNPGANARNLRSGQKIIIPALKETEPFRTEYTPAARWSESKAYVVTKGDTLWGIAVRFGTTVEEIALNNGIDAGGTLKTGAVLQVPDLK